MSTEDWQPSASIEALRKRAALIGQVRSFFAKRRVLEVETPLLMSAPALDPHIDSYCVNTHSDKRAYLQTSPEYAMKRLLAAGVGACYQITKAFRAEEAGKLHQDEFTMLEWYRPGFDHLQLMQEVAALLQETLAISHVEYLTYQELFHRYLDIDPLTATAADLRQSILQQQIACSDALLSSDSDTLLDFLFAHCIEPHLGQNKVSFVYHYPASKAALAMLSTKSQRVAERFEVFVSGIELANGYHELTDHDEQVARFEKNLLQRKHMQKDVYAMDKRFLAAMQAGIPDCAGVALGLDRLIMLALGTDTISDVISFTSNK